jgi:hypothetical protein
MEPGLRTYVLKRVGFAVLMLVGVSIILFTIMRLAPGGPEAVLIGGEFSQEAAAQIRQRLGLDRPLALQYLDWAGAALRGDLGRSFKTGDPVAALILDRLGPTVQLTFGALAMALVVAIRLGVLAAPGVPRREQYRIGEPERRHSAVTGADSCASARRGARVSPAQRGNAMRFDRAGEPGRRRPDLRRVPPRSLPQEVSRGPRQERRRRRPASIA